jgi:integrase
MGLPNPIARDYLLLLLFTGMRRTEAATLTWNDVDFVSKVLRVSAMKTKANRKLALPMTDVVHDLLVRRRQLGKDKFIFPANSDHGHIVDPKHPLRLIALATGIEISAHDLRRTYITTAESCDISWSALKLLVNHQLEGVTGGYVQVTPERLREPAGSAWFVNTMGIVFVACRDAATMVEEGAMTSTFMRTNSDARRSPRRRGRGARAARQGQEPWRS